MSMQLSGILSCIKNIVTMLRLILYGKRGKKGLSLLLLCWFSVCMIHSGYFCKKISDVL